MLPSWGGEVYWRQERLEAATHEIVKEGISFVPQGRRVFTHLTVEENLEMGCLYLEDGAEKARRLESVMELFNEVFQKVAEISDRLSTTILVVEHNIKGVLEIVDRAYVLDKGRVAHDGTPHSVRESDILTQVFLGS